MRWLEFLFVAEHDGGRGGRSFSSFSLKISQNSNEKMKEVEGLFIENEWVKGNNPLTSALMMRFLKTLIDNCYEKMESLSTV